MQGVRKMNQKVPYGFVYETINKVNEKKYIGKCVYYRQNNWKIYPGSGFYLQRAIKKYGRDNFERRILVEAFSEKELNQLEEEYILRFDAVNSPEYYNIKLTSSGGDIFTHNPRKEAIRLTRKRQMSGKGNHQHGKPKTQKMIDCVKEANSRAVIIQGVRYKSQSEAARILGLNVTTVNYRLDSKSFPDWQRLVSKNSVIRTRNSHPTCRIEMNGVTYNSIKEAATDLGLSSPTIIRRLDNKKFPNYKRLSERLR
jgi:hypothetical protein